MWVATRPQLLIHLLVGAHLAAHAREVALLCVCVCVCVCVNVGM